MGPRSAWSSVLPFLSRPLVGCDARGGHLVKARCRDPCGPLWCLKLLQKQRKVSLNTFAGRRDRRSLPEPEDRTRKVHQKPGANPGKEVRGLSSPSFLRLSQLMSSAGTCSSGTSSFPGCTTGSSSRKRAILHLVDSVTKRRQEPFTMLWISGSKHITKSVHDRDTYSPNENWRPQ